jgi:hypothetical protein
LETALAKSFRKSIPTQELGLPVVCFTLGAYLNLCGSGRFDSYVTFGSLAEFAPRHGDFPPHSPHYGLESNQAVAKNVSFWFVHSVITSFQFSSFYLKVGHKVIIVPQDDKQIVRISDSVESEGQQMKQCSVKYINFQKIPVFFYLVNLTANIWEESCTNVLLRE